MVHRFREEFNASFTPEKYKRLLADVDKKTRTHVGFRVSETPCFFERDLIEEMVEAGRQMTEQLVNDPEYLRRAAAAIPSRFLVPNQDAHPHFMTVDFGIVLEDGRPVPKLVELQAFPSVFGFQDVLARAYRQHYAMTPGLTSFLGEMDEEKYWKTLGEVILDGHDPRNVVLGEIHPAQQKTLPDFHVYEDRLGIRIVDLTGVRKEGRRLFYERDSKLELIERIYNRAIVDEIEQKKIDLPFSYTDDLDLSWAGHPNWYFLISKFGIPFLSHPCVPPAVFLDEWMEGGGRDRLADLREDLLLKPLYSFAGSGIIFHPTDKDLAAIPADDRSKYMVQQRVNFAPVIDTLAGPTQAEIRVLYVWPTAGDLTPVMSLVRMGRGKMMGVDHNRDQSFVGASAAFFV